MTGLDAFDGDAQPQPPDRELGEVEQRVGRGEGRAVVRADQMDQFLRVGCDSEVEREFPRTPPIQAMHEDARESANK